MFVLPDHFTDRLISVGLPKDADSILCRVSVAFHSFVWSPETGVRLYLDGRLADEAPGPIFPWRWTGEMLSIGDGPDYSPDRGGEWTRIDNNFIGRIYQLRVSNAVREF